MTQSKFTQILLSIFIVLVLFTAINSIFGIWTPKQNKQQESEVTESESGKINKNFVTGFFNYSTQAIRYKQVEGIMTTKGYHDTFPSGTEIPKEGTTQVSSSLQLLTTFENVVSETEKRYLNEILATTTFNGVSNSSKMIIKTTLVLIKGEGWKVDNVENVSIMDR